MRKSVHKIEKAGFGDAMAIFALVKEHPEEVLPRPLSDITQNIDRFLVCRKGKRVMGTVSWQILPEMGVPKDPSVELKSLSVVKDQQQDGIGRALVWAAIAEVKPLKPARIIALTFTPAFFRKLGFRKVRKEKLMHKLYAGCINCTKYDSPFTCPEVAMALKV